MDDDKSVLILPAHEWLHNFGLRASGLDMKKILEQIGFKHCNDFDFCLQKPICSRYGNEYFKKYFSSSGKVYNLMSDPACLAVFETKLQEKIKLLENRLTWMTTGSRRQFGLLCDKNVCIIVSMRPRNIAQHKEQVEVLKSVMEEQVSKTHSFTIIRASTQLEIFSKRILPTSTDTISSCIEWLTKLPIVLNSNIQALSQALSFSSDLSDCPSVYLFTDGISIHGHEKIFREELLNTDRTVNISCFMYRDNETFKFLKDLMKIKQSRFHAYSEIVEFDQFALDSNGHLKKEIKSLKGLPVDLELSPDVIEMHEELEEANCNLDQIRALLVQQIGYLNKGSELEAIPRIEKDVDKEYSIRSSVWLKQCGLKARKLLLKDALAEIAFRHCDQLKRYHVSNRRPISAKFCDKMVHLKWYDNSIVHIHVTEQFYQAYHQKMMCSIALYNRRLEWLSEGSRRIFGNITESRFCIIFDISLAMTENFDFFRDNFKILLYDQVKQKQRFNVAAINSKVFLWQEQMVNTTEENFARFGQWISKLKCSGKICLNETLLKSVMTGDFVPAIYLVLAGKPENIPQKIRKDLNIPKKVRFHTISFNCEDNSVNMFLIDLATETRGRFHYYSIKCDGTEYFGGEDMQLIQNEIDLANENLTQMTDLRSECALIRREKSSDCNYIR